MQFAPFSLIFEYFFASCFRISGDILAGSYYYFIMGIFFPRLEPVGRFQKAQRFPRPACFTRKKFVLSSKSLQNPYNSAEIRFLSGTLYIS